MKKAANNLKTLFIASIGSMFECYDFMVCVFLTPYLVKIFFAGNTQLGVFSIFTIAFFSRPLGGIFWGHLGDRLGRKLVFSLSMLAMVLPTLLIALFPTNINPDLNSIGFITLRALQGFLIGGEFAGGVTFISEIAPKEYRAAWIATFMAILSAGTLLASTINLIIEHYLGAATILAWGWRIPFLFSIFLIAITIYIRKLVRETDHFNSILLAKKVATVPLFRLFSSHTPALITGIFITTCSAMGLTTLYTFLPQILNSVRFIDKSELMTLTTIGLIILCLFMPFFGYLADRSERKRVFMTGMYLTTLTFGLFIISLKLENINLVFITMVLTSVSFAAVNAIYCVAISELFPTNVRFSGVALCYSLGYSLCGGLLPILYLKLIPVTKTFVLPCILFGVLTIILSRLIWRKDFSKTSQELPV